MSQPTKIQEEPSIVPGSTKRRMAFNPNRPCCCLVFSDDFDSQDNQKFYIGYSVTFSETTGYEFTKNFPVLFSNGKMHCNNVIFNHNHIGDGGVMPPDKDVFRKVEMWNHSFHFTVENPDSTVAIGGITIKDGYAYSGRIVSNKFTPFSRFEDDLLKPRLSGGWSDVDSRYSGPTAYVKASVPSPPWHVVLVVDLVTDISYLYINGSPIIESKLPDPWQWQSVITIDSTQEAPSLVLHGSMDISKFRLYRNSSECSCPGGYYASGGWGINHLGHMHLEKRITKSQNDTVGNFTFCVNGRTNQENSENAIPLASYGCRCNSTGSYIPFHSASKNEEILLELTRYPVYDFTIYYDQSGPNVIPISSSIPEYSMDLSGSYVMQKSSFVRGGTETLQELLSIHPGLNFQIGPAFGEEGIAHRVFTYSGTLQRICTSYQGPGSATYFYPSKMILWMMYDSIRIVFINNAMQIIAPSNLIMSRQYDHSTTSMLPAKSACSLYTVNEMEFGYYYDKNKNNDTNVYTLASVYPWQNAINNNLMSASTYIKQLYHGRISLV